MSVNHTPKDSPDWQILFKENWRHTNNGGMYLEYVEDRSGISLLSKTNLSDIKPNVLYYMQQIKKPKHFHPTTFSEIVSWSTIEELHKTGRIWQLEAGQQG